jgi:hypothetical protein
MLPHRIGSLALLVRRESNHLLQSVAWPWWLVREIALPAAALPSWGCATQDLEMFKVRECARAPWARHMMVASKHESHVAATFLCRASKVL